jgi:hypothetical protein
MKHDKIKNIIAGETAFCIGGGPHAKAIEHKNVLVSNLSFRLCPSPLVLYFADCSFYQDYKEEVDNVDAAYRMSSCQYFLNQKEWIVWHRKATTLHETNRLAGTNSGLHVLHIALRMGASPIVLSGYDLNDTSHFHNEYKMGEDTVVRAIREFEIMRGQEIYITNEDSALNHIFKYRPLRDFL